MAHTGREAAWGPRGWPGGVGRGAPRGLKGGLAGPKKCIATVGTFFERLLGKKNVGGRNAQLCVLISLSRRSCCEVEF